MSNLPYHVDDGGPRGIGQPPGLDKFVHDRLAEALRTGNTRIDAARYAGIGYSTFRSWMARGRTGERPYAAFVASMEKAEADAVIRNVAIIQKAAGVSWQAAAWWLERKFPELWSRDNVLIRQMQADLKRMEKLIDGSTVLPQATPGPPPGPSYLDEAD